MPPTQRIPGLPLVLTGHARAFCANFLRLQKLSSLVNLYFPIIGEGSKTAQNIRTTERLDEESRSTWLLDKSLQLLGFVSAGPTSLGSHNRDQTLGLRSDLPSTLQQTFAGLRREACCISLA